MGSFVRYILGTIYQYRVVIKKLDKNGTKIKHAWVFTCSRKVSDIFWNKWNEVLCLFCMWNVTFLFSSKILWGWKTLMDIGIFLRKMDELGHYHELHWLERQSIFLHLSERTDYIFQWTSWRLWRNYYHNHLVFRNV